MMDSSRTDQLYWVGIDWGKTKHTVAVCDDEQYEVACFEVRTTLEGLNELIARLGEFEVVGKANVRDRRPGR